MVSVSPGLSLPTRITWLVNLDFGGIFPKSLTLNATKPMMFFPQLLLNGMAEAGTSNEGGAKGVAASKDDENGVLLAENAKLKLLVEELRQQVVELQK